MKKTLSVLIALAVAAVPAISLAAYGGSASSVWSSLEKDVCPNGDYSNSYYDNDSGTNSNTEEESSEWVIGSVIDGYVFFDTNSNSILDNWEEGVQGAVITLKNAWWAILDTDVTNSNWYYAFLNVSPGTYRVHVSLPVTKTTFIQDVLNIFVPQVMAANDYEFTVVIEDTGSVTNNVPIVDGSATTVVTEEPTTEEEGNEEITEEGPSILDIIKESNAGLGDMPTSPSPTSSIGSNANWLVLPLSLPNTWVSL